MQNIDYTALYEQNADFKRYVDRYCTKHRISVTEALSDVPYVQGCGWKRLRLGKGIGLYRC